MEKTAPTLENRVNQEIPYTKKGSLIDRVEIEGPGHRIPIPISQKLGDKTPKKATKLGLKGGYALFYYDIPNGYNAERRGELEDISPDVVSVQYPNYSVYGENPHRFITYGNPVFYDT